FTDAHQIASDRIGEIIAGRTANSGIIVSYAVPHFLEVANPFAFALNSNHSVDAPSTHCKTELIASAILAEGDGSRSVILEAISNTRLAMARASLSLRLASTSGSRLRKCSRTRIAAK